MPMRVLWFSNSASYIPLSHTGGGGYNGGGWIPSLLEELKQQKDIEMGVCFMMDGQPPKAEQDGVAYYPVPNHRKRWKDKVLDLMYYRRPERDTIVWPHYKQHYRRVIDDFQPDVIEIFGTEVYLGLAAFVATCPVVLHVQGVLSLYIYTWLPPGVSLCSYLLQDCSPKRIHRRFQLWVYWQRSCYREQQVLQHIRHVIGRTRWDEMATTILNPKRIYHYGGEVLRKEFYDQWQRTIPKRLTIVTTSSAPMYKGFDYILRTAHILKSMMQCDFEWLVYGNVSPTYPEKFTGLHHEELNIRLKGVATATELCQALSCATLYFQPSYIENSPNSVCEAQMLGVPVVATGVGGTASLIEHGVTGILIPTNDPYTAAFRIRELAWDITHSEQIGRQGREEARKRHEKATIVRQLADTYREILSEARNTPGKSLP